MMLNISPEGIKWGIASVVLILLAWSVGAGVVAGRDLARARAIAESAQALDKGLQFFYGDQDRFPSELEYADGEKLSVYLKNFPGVSFIHKKWCASPPRYLSSGGSSYEYSYCLPRGWQGQARGWHVLTERGVQ